MTRRSILQVVTDTDRRGAQTFAADLHDALSARGCDIRTLALAAGTTDDPLFLSIGRHRKSALTLARLHREMRRAGVVVAHGSTTLPACSIGGVGSGTPFVYRSIGDPLYWANTPARVKRVRAMQSRAAVITALWPAAARALVRHLGASEKKVCVIPNGVSSKAFRPATTDQRRAAREALGLPEDALVVAYVGAMSVEKRVDLCLRATLRFPDVALVLAGDGPLMHSLQREAHELGHSRAQFIGRVRRPHQVYAAADLVVLPSRSEGLPGVLIEAGMCGLPAVATDVGGISEIVRPGETGELVQKPDVANLYRAMKKALDRRASYGRAARVRCATRFDIGAVADMWLRLLDGLSVRAESDAAGSEGVGRLANRG